MFLLAAEKLVCVIRKNNEIEGFKMGQGNYKISLYADDMTLFLKNGRSLENVLSTLDEFRKFSGLSLNYNKSFGLNFGTIEEIGEKGKGIQWVEEISFLGLNFHKNKSEATKFLMML